MGRERAVVTSGPGGKVVLPDGPRYTGAGQITRRPEPAPPAVGMRRFGPPDLAHPYQLGRHGGARVAPAGLDNRARSRWYYKYDEGARSQRIMRRWIATLPPNRTAPALVAEWHSNRAEMGLSVDLGATR